MIASKTGQVKNKPNDFFPGYGLRKNRRTSQGYEGIRQDWTVVLE